MMVADIDERMPADEFLGWCSYMRGPGAKTLPRDPAGIISELSKIGIRKAGQ
jgi:hypothetical protein